MSDKSHVSINTKLCPVCGKHIDVGILLDKRLRNSLEKNTITGWNDKPCDSCSENMNPSDGSGERVALVVIDEERSKFLANGNVDPNNAYRTGEIMFLRTTALKRLFKVPVPPKRLCFVPSRVMTMLTKMAIMTIKGE